MPAVRYRPFIDIGITLSLWAYFIFGFLFFFSPFYMAASLLTKNREAVFQRLNHYFYRSFFFFVRALIPKVQFQIGRRIKALRSCVVVCNHRSYLDPILLISLFPRHKTIVKHTLFRLPIFSWFLTSSGYLPSVIFGEAMANAIKQMEAMTAFLGSGGILFVFPEGTRRQARGLGRFNKGAFKIARKFGVPINVVGITNTAQLFPPGQFLFNTRCLVTISVDLVKTIRTDDDQDRLAMANLMTETRNALKRATR
jgi:1-acyl-sn-glycerol-3-phosphate acyltransferase